MGHKYYERLVFTKHRLGRIYCHQPEVMRVFIKRWKNKDWKEKEEEEKEASDFWLLRRTSIFNTSLTIRQYLTMTTMMMVNFPRKIMLGVNRENG